MRVLIVEDEESIRTILGEIIDSLGHNSFSAETAEQATEMLGMVKPELILLDLLLKGSLATPFIQVARSLMRDHPPRIVIVSAMTNAANVAETNDTEFLKKPFSLDDIQSIIEGKGDFHVRRIDREDDREPDEVVRPPQ